MVVAGILALQTLQLTHLLVPHQFLVVGGVLGILMEQILVVMLLPPVPVAVLDVVGLLAVLAQQVLLSLNTKRLI
ncbi:MAG: hypothetical protein EBR82_35245 [Caulobacteraceae bacterium]|nr:hypothetical protein [Caulobacteraceae bacterium]